MKWIKATKQLPRESGTYLVGVVDKDEDCFYHISSVFYSARHRRFNALDYQTGEEVKRQAFDNRFCYWMPIPRPPKGMTT